MFQVFLIIGIFLNSFTQISKYEMISTHNEKNKMLKNKKMNKRKNRCEQLVNYKIVFSVIHKVIHSFHR